MTAARIHPTAIVDPSAQLGAGVEIGPWALIGPGCTLGDGVVIHPRATLEENVILGREVSIGIGAILGGRPQDLKFAGEHTTVEIGDFTNIREYATINRGTSHSLATRVGKHSFLMAYTHLAHDCQVGDHVIMSNATSLAGHVIVEDWVIMSGLCAVHQFAKIGRHAFIGGSTRISKDIPPFVRAVGNPVKLYGLNTVGLQRRGFSEDVIAEIKKAYRLFFNSEKNMSQALEQARAELHPYEEIQQMIAFVEASGRGVTT